MPFPWVVSCWRIWKTCLCSIRKLWRIWKTCLYSHKEAYVSMLIVPVSCFYLCITLFVKTDVENATKLLPSLTGFLIALFPFHRRIVTFQGLLWTTIVMIYLIFGVQCTFKRVWQSMTEYVPSANSAFVSFWRSMLEIASPVSLSCAFSNLVLQPDAGAKNCLMWGVKFSGRSPSVQSLANSSVSCRDRNGMCLLV